MLIATDWSKEDGLPNDLIKGTAPLSGLFAIEPHRHSQLQPDIRLTAEEAVAMSPMYLPPVAKGSSIVAVGGIEPDLFHWQSLEYAARLPVTVAPLPLGAPRETTATVDDFRIERNAGRASVSWPGWEGSMRRGG